MRALTTNELESLRAAIDLAGEAWKGTADAHALDKLDADAVRALVNGHELIVHVWAREHGDCYDCGLPAAFTIASVTGDAALRCAVCAANAAAVDGETISRIVPLD